MSDFGARLKRLRRAAGLSLRAMAESVGVCAVQVANLERAAHVPRSDTLSGLATRLCVTMDYLYHGPNDFPPVGNTTVRILYTDRNGRSEWVRVTPFFDKFGMFKERPDAPLSPPQWHLCAWDHDEAVQRCFARRRIVQWHEDPIP